MLILPLALRCTLLSPGWRSVGDAVLRSSEQRWTGGSIMKLFECQACGQPLYFENTSCESCGRRLGYLPYEREISALEARDRNWTALAAPDSQFRYCANAE